MLADLEFVAPNSGTYFVRVTGDAHVTTRYQLLLVGPAPAHDTCVNPGVIRDLVPGQPQTFEASNAGAHHSTESACGGAGEEEEEEESSYESLGDNDDDARGAIAAI